ncbi:hypothetical protein LSTR_LSTR000739 [Laodelphax striatellus]|uniref:Misato Segment II tubulin-like domain-containing protein n=1 Tax=Laodelphax striatellus TaxID=195883 RepID=A0A482XGD4_LAOST|nr:hypothetical protein LSTR_LSTR000739 [Laodelphax striatellus]
MSITGREIITLQIGHYSNYVGAHWWNLQEAAFTNNSDSLTEINNDVLFREGETRRGEVTFTPRLVLSDLKGSLGALTVDGGLYEDQLSPDPSLALWPEDRVEVEAADEAQKNEFLNDLDACSSRAEVCSIDDVKKEKVVVPKRYCLDESVNVWSDYLRTFYHPRSLAITNEYKHNDDNTPFKFYGQGIELWKNEDYQEDFAERIRAYMEEADNSQHLKDEYPSKASVAVVCLPSFCGGQTSTEDDSIRVLNWALTLGSLPELCSLFTPASTVQSGWRQPDTFREFTHLNYNKKLHYHSSAIIAAGLETVSLLYRLRSSRASLKDVTCDLRVLGRAASAISVTLPFAIGQESSLLETLENWNGPLMSSLSPYCSLDKVDLQSVVIRGVSNQRLMSTESVGSMLESLHNEAKRIKIRRLPGFLESGLEILECDEKLEQLLCLSECYAVTDDL